ncbi:MFS transporter [Amycolatopsis sp. NPDC058986]|uniref:MFS transporter n=1 Tax=unclassified Amycolatopsis TaxID=2618356 RepID=UPI00366DC800
MTTTRRRGGLLRQHDFRRLWLADGFSQFGDRVSFMAVPLLAATTLHASAFEVSLLRTVQTAAYLVLGLQVGAWCDRLRCRPVLLIADLGQATVFASVPIAAMFGVLSLAQLYVVVAIAGVLSVFFTVAHQTYLPRLVARDDLTEGNARLQANLSVAAVSAPTASGLLLQYLGGPAALGVDALSFLWSAGWLSRIRTREPKPERPERVPMRREIAEGITYIVRRPDLRAFAGSYAQTSLFQAPQLALGTLFLLREIHLSPGAIGLVGTIGLTGALTGAATARRLGDRFGNGRMLWVSGLLFGLGTTLAPLTQPGWLIALYTLGGFLNAYSITVMSILMVSHTQVSTPPELRGRVTATMRFLVFGIAPIGAALTGVLGETLGLRTTLWIGAAGIVLAALWLWPVRRGDFPTGLKCR